MAKLDITPRIDPRFYEDNMQIFIQRMKTYAQQQGTSVRRLVKAVKFLNRVTTPEQKLDEVFLNHLPTELRAMDPAETPISQEKLSIIGLTLWNLYKFQWSQDCMAYRKRHRKE